MELEIFQEESFKNEIERGISMYFDKEEYYDLQITPQGLLELIPTLFPENSKYIFDFFIKNLPILEEKEIIDEFIDFYSEIYDYFKENGMEKQSMEVKERIKGIDIDIE